MPRLPLRPLGAALACLALAGTARADDDIARLTMGRVTNPAGSYVVEVLPAYRFTAMGEPQRDTFGGELSLEYAPTDAFTLGFALEIDDSPRWRATPDHAALGAAYRVLQDPIQLAVEAELRPAINGGTHQVAWGASLLKRIGPALLRADYGATLGVIGGPAELEQTVEADAYYLFGLNGVAGAGFEYRWPDQLLAELSLGGRVSPNVFLAISVDRGLTAGAPTFEVALQIHLYFGPYRVAGFE